MVLEKELLTPIMILIHQEAPHDTKLFTEIMETLKKIKNNTIIRHNTIRQRILQL